MFLFRLLQHITGEVSFSQLKSPGEVIKKGELLTEIKQDGKHLAIFSPISGEVIDTNADLNEHPAVVNEDPYDKGWIYRIRPTNWMVLITSMVMNPRNQVAARK